MSTTGEEDRTEQSENPLVQSLDTAAPVRIHDESGGVYGELISPETVISSLMATSNVEDEHSNLVGRVDVNPPISSASSTSANPTSPSTVPLRSLTFTDASTGDRHEVKVEIFNSTNSHVRVRWINESGTNPATHRWTIAPLSELVQYSFVGHLFILSLVTATATPSDLFDDSRDDELVIGAYRTLRSLPSGTPHCLFLQERPNSATCATSHDTSYVLESLLLDETKQDSLVAAASTLDCTKIIPSHSNHAKLKQTLRTLKTIVANILKYPNEEKYQTIRLTNPKVQRDIVQTSWDAVASNGDGAAIRFLRALGFQNKVITDGTLASVDENEFLILSQNRDRSLTERSFERARELLELLLSRIPMDHNNQQRGRNFIAELAPPTPWDSPNFAEGRGALAAGRNNWNTRGTHFVTDEERWARAERIARLRRGPGGRRPEPGNAPSSRGTWGR